MCEFKKNTFLRGMNAEYESKVERQQLKSDSRFLWFNREGQQRYQWSTTAGSTSSREKCLMDVEHDIGCFAVLPHNSRHVT